MSVVYPEPFRSVLEALRFVQLDFLSADCLDGRPHFMRDVFGVSLAPPLLALLVCAATELRVAAIRVRAWREPPPPLPLLAASAPSEEDGDRGPGAARGGTEEAAEKAAEAVAAVRKQRTGLVLILFYVVFPGVALYHFKALHCGQLEDGTSYLRASTDVDCDSAGYRLQRVGVFVLIALYQLVPLGMLSFVYSERFTLNPVLQPGKPNSPADMEAVLALRERHRCDCTARFLWQDYRPSSSAFEVVEMYRRVFFVAVLPLCAGGPARTAIGVFASLLWAIYAREAAPFIDPLTNALLTVAAWQILVSYLGALMLASDSLASFGLSDFGLGLGLTLANVVVVVFAGAWVVKRHREDEQRQGWNHALSSEQAHILDLVMNAAAGPATAEALEAALSPKPGEKGKGDRRGSAGASKSAAFAERDPNSILRQYMIDAAEVELREKLGAGAFGEVFKARVHGTIVVAKTMIEVTEVSARAFRGELLLTATLRHPKIVNFVGCCWGQKLTCMLLEWVPNGSMTGLLERPGLLWAAPLLALATDVAQGMLYLHSREVRPSALPPLCFR